MPQVARSGTPDVPSFKALAGEGRPLVPGSSIAVLPYTTSSSVKEQIEALEESVNQQLSRVRQQGEKLAQRAAVQLEAKLEKHEQLIQQLTQKFGEFVAEAKPWLLAAAAAPPCDGSSVQENIDKLASRVAALEMGFTERMESAVVNAAERSAADAACVGDEMEKMATRLAVLERGAQHPDLALETARAVEQLQLQLGQNVERLADLESGMSCTSLRHKADVEELRSQVSSIAEGAIKRDAAMEEMLATLDLWKNRTDNGVIGCDTVHRGGALGDASAAISTPRHTTPTPCTIPKEPELIKEAKPRARSSRELVGLHDHSALLRFSGVHEGDATDSEEDESWSPRRH